MAALTFWSAGHCATVFWDNSNGNNQFNLPPNWDPNGNPANQDVVIDQTHVNPGTIDLTAGITVASLTLGDPDAFTLNLAGHTLLINSGSLVRTSGAGGSHLITGGTLQFNGTAAMNIAGSGSLTIASVVDDLYYSGLTKTGSGTLVLSGANTFQGVTAVNAGTLVLANSSALGSSTFGNTVASGAGLHFQGGITVTEGSFTVTGSGSGPGATGVLRNVSGNNTLASTVTLGGASTFVSAADRLTIGGTVSLNGHALTLDGAGDLRFSSAVSGTGSVQKTGSGTAEFQGGTNITGSFSHTGGAVSVTGNLVATTGITLASSGNVAVSGNVSTAGNMVVSGAGLTNVTGNISATGSFSHTGTGNVSVTGNLAANSGLTLSGDGDVSLTGHLASSAGAIVISGAGDVTATGGINSAAGGITISGTGDRTFSGPVNTAGGLAVSGDGLTTITGNINAGSTAVSFSGPGDVVVSGAQINSGGLSITGSGAVSSSSTLNLGGGDLAIGGSGTVNLSGSAINVGNVAITGSATTTLDTQINATGGSFTQSGTGTTTFTGTGTNYFNSVNITGGTIVLEQTGGQALQVGSGNVNISGAEVFFEADNQIANWNNVTLGTGATLYLNDTSQDIAQLIVTGNSVIDFGAGGATLDATSLTLTGDSVLTIVNWNRAVDVFLANVDPGSSNLAKVIFEGYGDAVWDPITGTVTPGAPVPEPSAYGLLCGGALATFFLTRRRRR